MFEIIVEEGKIYIIDSYKDDGSFVNKNPIENMEIARKVKAALMLEYSEKHCTDKSETTRKEFINPDNVHVMC